MKPELQNSDLLVECIDLLINKMVEAPQPGKKKWTPEEEKELYSYAYHFYQNGKYSEAVDFFRTLTTIDGRDVAYWTGLASALKMQKQYEKALETYSVAAFLNPEDPYIHAHAADCCFALGQIEQGMMALSSAEMIVATRREYQDLASKLDAIREAWTNNDRNDIVENNKEA